MSIKHGIDIAAGVIDSDYRGPVGIVRCNNGKYMFEYEKGERIAQLILEKCATPPAEESELDATERGAKGFGSTGKMAHGADGSLETPPKTENPSEASSEA